MGGSTPPDVPGLEGGYYVKPTILNNVPVGSSAWREAESSGPALRGDHQRPIPGLPRLGARRSSGPFCASAPSRPRRRRSGSQTTRPTASATPCSLQTRRAPTGSRRNSTRATSGSTATRRCGRRRRLEGGRRAASASSTARRGSTRTCATRPSRAPGSRATHGRRTMGSRLPGAGEARAFTAEGSRTRAGGCVPGPFV